MDGMLMFFEQESYAFGRYLPGFLLPGPLRYSPKTDSFITVSSCRQVESYKYQVLAVATDADTKKEIEQQKIGSGKKLLADWILNIGEQALDLSIVSFNHTVFSIFVLGERNVFCLKENGQIRFMKKLEYSPSCFLPYCSVSEGTINSLVGNHNNMLLVYQDVTLRWAAQLPHIPVAVKVVNFQDMKGIIVTLSDSGHLQCSYFGTDPSLFQAPKVESRDINYEELDTEMKELQKIIKEATKTQDILPKVEKEDDLTILANVSPALDAVSQAADSAAESEAVPSVTVKFCIRSRLHVQKTVLSISVPPFLALTQDQFIFYSIVPGLQSGVEFSVKNLCRSCSNSSLTKLNPEGVPRVAQCKFRLPLRLVCLPVQPSKAANHRLTIDTNKPPVNLVNLFPDFVERGDDDQVSVLGFHLLAGQKVTLLASKTSQRYRIQSEKFEDLWLITKELILRFEEYFLKQGIKDFTCLFSGPIPLQEYFELIDQHFELRMNTEKYENLLTERAVQFRAIQKLLLTRFKDKTPAPLQNLDTLLDGTYRQVIGVADHAEELQNSLFRAFIKLKTATQLIIVLIGLWQKLSKDQIGILESTFLPLQQDGQELGWEESVDAALSHLLRTCLSKSSKEQALNLTSQLSIPKDTSKLKKHITLLCDRLAKGGRLSLSADSGTQQSILLPGESVDPQDKDTEAGI
ncbi:PTHB1 N-terminus [Pristimantis euphronides]